MRIKTFKQWLLDNPEFRNNCEDCNGVNFDNCSKPRLNTCSYITNLKEKYQKQLQKEKEIYLKLVNQQ